MNLAASFAILIHRIQPTDAEVARARQHATVIRTRLQTSFNLKRFIIAGSYSRGTSIHNSSDIDLFAVVSRDEARWGGSYISSTTMLDNIRHDLESRFPFTPIFRDVHAIVSQFGTTRVDVVPAIFWGINEKQWPLYQMPDGAGTWMQTSPPTHNRYIKHMDSRSGGKLHRTAQLLKFWKNCRTPQVPLSSFHIEMLLGSGRICEGTKSYAACVTETLQLLAARECQALRDPLGIAGNIGATRSYFQRETALRSVVYSRDHAKDALRAEALGDTREAKRQWNIVFNGQFPS